MATVIMVAVAAVGAAVAWSWAGRQWAFPRLPEVVAASGVTPQHLVWASNGYRVLWHAAGVVWSVAAASATMLALDDQVQRLQVPLLVCLVAQCVGMNLVLLQAMPNIRRHVPRSRSSAVALWTLLACVLWAAWHYAK